MIINPPPARYIRLLEAHPTMIKLSKLIALAEELGLSFTFFNGRAIIEDNQRDKNLPDMFIEDIENNMDGAGCDHPMENFPPTTEFKVVYDSPKFLAYQKAENETRALKWKQEEAVKKTAQESAKQIKEKKQLEEKETQDRKLFEQLKSKFEK